MGDNVANGSDMESDEETSQAEETVPVKQPAVAYPFINEYKVGCTFPPNEHGLHLFLSLYVLKLQFIQFVLVTYCRGAALCIIDSFVVET